jgi:hypothetical protein
MSLISKPGVLTATRLEKRVRSPLILLSPSCAAAPLSDVRVGS